MYTGLIVFAVLIVLGFAAIIFFAKRSDRAFTRRVELMVKETKDIKRNSV